ncbi:MAG: ATP-dependent DNA helicase [Tissierellia bacterium]|nr:ATP-dependent DNA helicase [Tissierellia bacterium]
MKDVQKEIIENLKTPAVVIAGPGCGKTYTIVKTIVNLIKKGINPKKMFISSFTKKASNELIVRLMSEFKKENIDHDASTMMIGTFHSLVINLLNENRFLFEDKDPLKIIDENYEGYLIEKNLDQFLEIKDYNKYFSESSKDIINNYEEIENNLIDINELKNPKDDLDDFEKEKMKISYQIYIKHKKLLEDNGLLNYTGVLKKFYDLLNNPQKREFINKKIDFIIIDEYQDTNFIQQEILFKLLEDKNNNIMVVGDDDQSLYRFRSADPYNITHFKDIYYNKRNVRINKYILEINYRSSQKIIDFYSKWLKSVGDDFWGDQRFEKKIRAYNTDYDNDVRLIKSKDIKQIADHIKDLHQKIEYRQIAFLFPSLKNYYVKNLQKELEANDIPVLNPKSGEFFMRDEIRILIFCYLVLFSNPIKKTFGQFLGEEAKRIKFKNYIADIWHDKKIHSFKELTSFLKQKRKEIASGKKIKWNDLNFKILEFNPFKTILESDDKSVKSLRAKSNISSFFNLISNYADFNDFRYLDKKIATYLSYDFIYGYLFYIFKLNRIEEFQNLNLDIDAVNFTTIHQSKGLEFDIVFISSFGEFNFNIKKDIYDHFKRYEKDEDILEQKRRFEQMDQLRKYYTAFSRAKKVLYILDNSYKANVLKFMEYKKGKILLNELNLNKKKFEDKKMLSYTADISIYEKCPFRYKLVRLLGFKEISSIESEFGSKIHSIIEYINNAKKESFNLDYNYLNKQDERIKKVISNYLNNETFKRVKNSELNVKKDMKDYILQGNIDIELENSSLVDIKTGKRDSFKEEGYVKQLNFYDFLTSEKRDLYLYYIEEDNLVKVKNLEFEIDLIARRLISEKKFEKTNDLNNCIYCPFKYLCKRY